MRINWATCVRRWELGLTLDALSTCERRADIVLRLTGLLLGVGLCPGSRPWPSCGSSVSGAAGGMSRGRPSWVCWNLLGVFELRKVRQEPRGKIITSPSKGGVTVPLQSSGGFVEKDFRAGQALQLHTQVQAPRRLSQTGSRHDGFSDKVSAPGLSVAYHDVTPPERSQHSHGQDTVSQGAVGRGRCPLARALHPCLPGVQSRGRSVNVNV